MSQMPEPLSTIRQTNFSPSAERLSSSDNQSFTHHVQTLYQLEAPNANIYLALSTQLPVSNLIETFHASAKQIDLWLEYANIAIFALELDVREGTNVKSVGEMDVLIHKFAPNIDLLQELSQTIFNNLKDSNDEEKRKDIQDTLDRIYADWVDAKAFFGRVKKEMSESKQRRELLDTMDLILASIEELNTSIFEYQEQRLSGENGSEIFPFPKLSSSPTTRNSSIISNNSQTEFSSRSDVALMQLDSRLEPLSARIEYLRSRLSAPNAPSDPNGALAKKNNILSNKWDALKHEMETLREELKEDRWLGVFKQVTGNAGQMMDSLERAVRQSITYKNFQRLYKTFDAKRKYYVPTVTKMLTMLANGINQQMTKDRDAIKKYRSMKERWDTILDGVAEVQHDMPGIEALLDHSLVSSNSPPSSIPSSIASSPPMSPNMKPRGMFSPESGSPPTRGQRSLSPHRVDYLESPLNNVRSPSLRSKSPSPRATSPLGGSRNYLTSASGRSVSPTPTPDRPPWNSYYNQTYNYNNLSNGHHTISPLQGNGRPSSRSGSPIRSPLTRAISPERINPSNIPRPVTSMGITNRAPSRVGMRSFLPQPSTPQPGMVSSTRLGMISPPPMRRHHQIRTPTPSSVTSSLSRPITPENDDRPMTPLTERLSSMSVINDRNSNYIPLKNDPLDIEVAKIVNSLPLNIKVERAPGGGGKYYFGREKKVFSCKLVNYAASNRNKVIVRVGGGSQDLDMFLLEHSLTSVREVRY
ncbi:26233_t:CDS:2 [Dentiscutata erythropus]|uniref:26233_t:CDS:1 n=1 Tax=Dentiscutata erythropus TaxID=1348616 RepID=A0A9N9HUN4_9GLOM|nr:26233_t:CDS:2 [Dentiscutata erythropus]